MRTIPPAPPRRGFVSAILIAQLAYGLVAMTICLPSMQEWPAIFGASQASVQLTFSGFVATYGGLQLVYGPVSDRHGRKPALLFGTALAVLAAVAAALAPNLGLLTLARIVQGAGCAACMVVGRAMVQDLFAGPERTRMMAFVGMIMGLCPPLATLVGGQLHVRLGWPSIFVLLAVLGGVLLAATWRVLPAPTGGAAAPQGGWRTLVAGYAQLARLPAFLLYVAMLACTTATFYAFLGGAPLVLAGYGVGPDRVGWYIMAPPLAYILGNILTARLVRWLGDGALMMLGQVTTLAGLLLVLVLALAGSNTPLSLALPMLLLGIGHGLLVPPMLTGTVGLVPALAGSAAAVAGLAQQLNGAVGGYLVGLVPHDGAANLALMMIGWTVLGLAAQLLLMRVLRRPR